MYSMGASSRSPSPMTMVPAIGTSLEGFPHGLDSGLVGALAVALAHGAGRCDGGFFHYPRQFESQLLIDVMG